MKVLVAVKRVIDYNVKPRVKMDGTGVDLTNVKMSMLEAQEPPGAGTVEIGGLQRSLEFSRFAAAGYRATVPGALDPAVHSGIAGCHYFLVWTAGLYRIDGRHRYRTDRN